MTLEIFISKLSIIGIADSVDLTRYYWKIEF